MKPKTFSATTRPMSRATTKHHKRGFALIVTLSLMILLTVIAVGLLSLSSIALRSSSSESNSSIARANARMALMIAAAELQKHAGGDQRVTGCADLLSATSPNPMWTAVWNSRGGEPAFLISGNEQSPVDLETMPTSMPASYFSPQTKLPDEGSVALFGSNLTRIDQVRAPLVKVNGSTAGSYAYWVADEGVKARFNTSNPYAPGEANADQKLAAAVSQSNSPRYASSDLKTNWPVDNKNAKMAITLAQGQLVAPKTTKFAESYFHSLTPYSRGLLTDAKNGGLKRDLTQAFEDDMVFQKWFGLKPIVETIDGNISEIMREFGDYRKKATVPLAGYNLAAAPEQFFITNRYEYLKDGVKKLTGPNFGNLRFFYQSYKSNTNGSLENIFPYPASNNAPVVRNEWNPYQNFSDPSWPINTDAQHTNFVVAPMLARAQMGYRLTTEPVPGDPEGKYRAVVEFKPLIGLWNPYNVTIRPTVYRIDWEMSPVFDITIAGNTAVTKLTDWYGNTTLDNGVSQGETLNVVIRQPIDFQPGEFRMFSTMNRRDLRPKTTYQDRNAGLTLFFEPRWGEPNVMRMILPAPGSDVNKTFVPWTFAKTASVKVNKVFLSEGTSNKGYTDKTTAGNYIALKPGVADRDQAIVSNFRTTNLWQSGVSNMTPESIDDLPPLSAEALNISPQTIATWSFSLRSTVEGSRIGQPPQRIRNLIDSNVRCLVANSRWDGSIEGKGMTCISPFVGDGPNGRGKVTGTGEPESAGSRYNMLGGNLKQSHVVAFDVPSSRPLSLGHFQHATLGRYNYEPSYILGNSYANPRIPLNKDINTTFLTGTDQLTVHDSSYIINDAIWDKYFLSGLSPLASDLPDATFTQIAKGEKPAPNSRITLLEPEKPKSFYINPADDLVTSELAGKLAVEGAFNVNSTSVKAWRAVLAGMADVDLPTFNGATNSSTVWKNSGGVSFPRFSRIPGEKDDFWKGYFALTETQLDNLAIEIVNQVRARGPFRSIGAFVNRSLTDKKNAAITTERDIKESGALQAALDSQKTKINAAIPSTIAQTTDDLAGDFQKITAGQSQAAGNAGFLLQGDILQALAPVITVRSDTFVIRTYGSAVDKSGKTTAKAWCEAVIQRTPKPLLTKDKPDSASSATDTTLDKPGITFGRKFEIISFRWLSPNEI
jgi:hypothetical protein